MKLSQIKPENPTEQSILDALIEANEITTSFISTVRSELTEQDLDDEDGYEFTQSELDAFLEKYQVSDLEDQDSDPDGDQDLIDYLQFKADLKSFIDNHAYTKKHNPDSDEVTYNFTADDTGDWSSAKIPTVNGIFESIVITVTDID